MTAARRAAPVSRPMKEGNSIKLLLAFGTAAAATMAFSVACDDCSSTASCNGEVSNVPNEDAGPTIDAISPESGRPDVPSRRRATAPRERPPSPDVVVHGEASIPRFVRGPSGAVDTTFGGGMISGTFKDIGVLAAKGRRHHDAITTPEGKVLVVGHGTRFNEDGTVDTSFGVSGFAAVPETVYFANLDSLHLSLDASHRILVSGSAIVRFTADGNDGDNFSVVRDGPLGTYLVAEDSPRYGEDAESTAAVMSIVTTTVLGEDEYDIRHVLTNGGEIIAVATLWLGWRALLALTRLRASRRCRRR